MEMEFPDIKHIQSQGIRAEINNNRSERLQGTYRQRVKTLRGLDSLETGQRYLDGWTLTYNLFREHESLGFDTSGKRAKVNPPFAEWEDVVLYPGKPEKKPAALPLKRREFPDMEVERAKKGGGGGRRRRKEPKAPNGVKVKPAGRKGKGKEKRRVIAPRRQARLF